MIKPRHKEFLTNYAKTSNITQSAIKAGYSPIYADKLGKVILNNAIKHSARDILKETENKTLTTPEVKMFMHELLGLSREDVFEVLKKIALQDKDYASAIKILAPLSKEIGIALKDDEQVNVTVPVLNVVVEKSKELPESQ